MVLAEQELRDENESITDQDETLADLEKQINQVKDLIKREEDVEKDAEAAKDKGLDALDEVADKQRDVRRDSPAGCLHVHPGLQTHPIDRPGAAASCSQRSRLVSGAI